MEIFRARIEAWPWLSEKFGLNQFNGQTLTHVLVPRTGIYLSSHEIGIVLSGCMVLPNKDFRAIDLPDKDFADVDIDPDEITPDSTGLKRKPRRRKIMKRKWSLFRISGLFLISGSVKDHM